MIVFGLHHLINPIFYYDPRERKCFSINNTEVVPLNLATKSISVSSFNELIENLRGLV